MSDVIQFYNKCPECECRRSDLIEKDPHGEIYPSLLLVRSRLKNFVDSFGKVETRKDFVSMRENLKREYGIHFLIQENGKIHLENHIPGLCKRTRNQIQVLLDNIDPDIAKNVLVEQM